MKSSIFTILAFLSISLASCSKDKDADPIDKLSGTSKEVNDLIWGKTITSGEYEEIIIGETIEYKDYNPSSEISENHSFVIKDVTPYETSKPGEQSGEGVSYSNTVYQVTAVKLDDFPDIITIAIYESGVLKGSLAYHY